MRSRWSGERIRPEPRFCEPSAAVSSRPANRRLIFGDGNFGIAYVVCTLGTADSAVGGGVGYACERGYSSTNGAAVVMIGGGILTGGVLWLGEHLSADLATVVPADGDSTVAFPPVKVVDSFSP